MTDDELIDDLRRSLTTRASGVTSRPDAWETFQQRVDATMRPAPSTGRRTRWLPVAVAAVAGVALAAAVAFAIVRSSSPTVSKGPRVGAHGHRTANRAGRLAAVGR